MLQLEDRPKLSARLSASLDVARAIAACYVVLHHVANARGWSNGPGLVLRFGQEAVLIFFLLSGFVIFSNERTRLEPLDRRATTCAGYAAFTRHLLRQCLFRR
jgi:peptidoglycan/LPS O-acetylase OafA/YrhL